MKPVYRETTIRNTRVQPYDGVHILIKTLPEEQQERFIAYMKGRGEVLVKILIGSTFYYAVTFPFYYKWFSTWYEKKIFGKQLPVLPKHKDD